MSESFATNRPPGGAEEFDRRRRMAESRTDPLAELARLVGQDDPFRNVVPQLRATLPAAASGFRPSYASFTVPERDDAFRGAPDAGEEAGAPDDPAIVHAAPDGTTLRGSVAPEVNADAWAQGVAPAPAPDLVNHPGEGGSARRTLVVLAAVVALTGGGLAASFLVKPSHTAAVAAASSTATPTILAATGPSKVQPDTQAADPNAPSEPSTLLDKNKNDGTSTAKVVNSVEQPVDLAQAVKPVPSANTAAGTVAHDPDSPFPEPRKVKTVLVRPDGSIIDNAAPAAPAAAQPPNAAALAFDPSTAMPAAAPPPPATPDAGSPVAAPATPAAMPPGGKSQARIVTPKSAPADVSAAAGHGAAAPARPRVAAKPKPVDQADATATLPTTAAPDAAPTGAFAAQLGAAGSEAEARDLSARLSRKFADTVGGKLVVRKAQSGAKTVYRVRAAGLSQDDAKAVCAKVAAGGGGCFVARD